MQCRFENVTIQIFVEKKYTEIHNVQFCALPSGRSLPPHPTPPTHAQCKMGGRGSEDPTCSLQDCGGGAGTPDKDFSPNMPALEAAVSSLPSCENRKFKYLHYGELYQINYYRQSASTLLLRSNPFSRTGDCRTEKALKHELQSSI